MDETDSDQSDSSQSGDYDGEKCRFGRGCTREGCWFEHPNGRVMDEMRVMDEIERRRRKSQEQKEKQEAQALAKEKELQNLVRLKASGNKHFRALRFQDAFEDYSAALRIDDANDEMKAVLLCNRAAAASGLNMFSKVVDDCTHALKLRPSYAKAMLRRARAFVCLNQRTKAILDFERYLFTGSEVTSAADARKEMAECKAELSREKERARRKAPGGVSRSTALRPESHYKVLGVGAEASAAQIKKAYRKLALKFHPDKNKAKGAEETFKKISMAYTVLSSPASKKAYDLEGSFAEQCPIQ